MTAPKTGPAHELPWSYQENSDAYTHIIRGKDGELLASFGQDSTGGAEADARYTVRAVNSLPALDAVVKALEELLDMGALEEYVDCGEVQDARAALALAKGRGNHAA